MKRIIVILLYLIPLFVFAQNNCTDCPDFLNLQGTCVVPTFGYTTNPLLNNGISSTRHTIITEQGFDQNTGNQLPLLPPGENMVVKLGNNNINNEAEALEYTFKVSPQQAMLLLKFAVIMEDPGHEEEGQPRFKIRVLNANGDLVNECAEYDVASKPNIEGFQKYNAMGEPILWRPWTSLGVDLSQFIGQNVKVQVTTYDCAHGGHFGYAYFTAKCITSKLNVECNTNNVILTAPDFFKTYEWSNGDLSQTSTYNVVNGAVDASCLITSETGCQFTLNMSGKVNPLPASNSIAEYSDVVCQGSGYNAHGFNLPSQKTPGTFVHVNDNFDLATCSIKSKSILRLTVVQKFYNITEAICEGYDYKKNGFSIKKPPIGVLYDTLSFKGSNGCDSIVCLELTVSPSVNSENALIGELHPCQTQTFEYSLQNVEGWTSFNWQVPKGFSVIDGQGKPSAKILFTDAAKKGEIILQLKGGCGTADISLEIEPRLTHYLYKTDTICAGNTYNKNGFSISKIDSAGIYKYVNKFKTSFGCDSIISLYLYVAALPDLIISSKDVICSGDSVEIKALGNQFIVPQTCERNKVEIGDIVLLDNTIIKPHLYSGTAAKSIKGVVFYVDSTNEHGWIVEPTERLTEWSFNYSLYTPLPMLSIPRAAIEDLGGQFNTQAWKSDPFGYNIAVHMVNTSGGWYVPAAGQLNVLYAHMDVVNKSMLLTNSQSFFTLQTYNQFDPGKAYWSSTLAFNGMWLLSEYGEIKPEMKINVKPLCIGPYDPTNCPCPYPPCSGMTMGNMYILRAVANF